MNREQLETIQQKVWDWLEDAWDIQEIASSLSVGRETVYKYCIRQRDYYITSMEPDMETHENIQPRNLIRLGHGAKAEILRKLGYSQSQTAKAFKCSQPYVAGLLKMERVWGATGIVIEITGNVTGTDTEVIPTGIYEARDVGNGNLILSQDRPTGRIIRLVEAEALRGQFNLVSIHTTKLGVAGEAAV